MMAGVPSQRRHERREQEILKAALARFAAEGYFEASMQAIAEDALLTRAGLYKRAKDKATLFKRVRRWKADELALAVQAAVADAATVRERLTALIRATLVFQVANPHFFRLLLTTAGHREVAAGDAFDGFAAVLVGVLAEGQAAGGVTHEAPPEELAMLLVGLLFKNPIKRDVLGVEPPTSLEQDARLIGRAFLDGVLVGS